MLEPKTRERWSNVLLRAKPGLYNSYGLYSHTLEEETHDPIGWAEVRAELDIKDSVDASSAHDLQLTAQFFRAALASELK